MIGAKSGTPDYGFGFLSKVRSVSFTKELSANQSSNSVALLASD